MQENKKQNKYEKIVGEISIIPIYILRREIHS